MRPILALLIWSVPIAGGAESMHLYKSVHADGTVGYSDTRPSSATSVTTMPVPEIDPAIVKQGQRRSEEMRAIADDLEKQRIAKADAWRKREKALAKARQELSSAERGLAATRRSKHNATQERIALAEQRLALARRRLRELEGAAP